MWCPRCAAVTACKAVEPKEVKTWLKSGRRWYKTEHEDVHWFRRGRVCLRCGNGFVTSEVNETFIDELTELRDSLAAIKRDTESYIERSQAAAESLTSLNDSLEKLRALKIYKKQKS